MRVGPGSRGSLWAVGPTGGWVARKRARGTTSSGVLIHSLSTPKTEEARRAPALIRVSTALTGGTRGGPAHAAVVASGLFVVWREHAASRRAP